MGLWDLFVRENLQEWRSVTLSGVEGLHDKVIIY
jgi:hypothetical protein